MGSLDQEGPAALGGSSPGSDGWSEADPPPGGTGAGGTGAGGTGAGLTDDQNLKVPSPSLLAASPVWSSSGTSVTSTAAAAPLVAPQLDPEPAACPPSRI